MRPHSGRVTGCLLPLLLALLVGGGSATVKADPAGNPSPEVVTLDVDSTSVSSVLEVLAVRSGLNIVTEAGIGDRRISLRLHNTPFDEALNLVVRAAGLSYERMGRSIIVADRERLNASAGWTSRVFDLRYSDAEEVRGMLEILTKEVSADTLGHRLLVRAAPAVMAEVAAAIDQIDQKPVQILLEARLIEVNTSALQEIGVDWEKITKWSTVLTEGYHGRSEKGAFPSDLGWLKLGDSESYFRQVQAFEVAVDALLTQGNARLLANSRVVTLDGRAAEIFAGETVPVVITSLSQGGTGGVLQSVQLEKIDVGVKLRIVPRISGEKTITTLVEPEVSRIVAFIGPDNDLPQTSTRRARTIIRVQEGQKIYMGGLLSEEKRRTVKSVPFLGTLPLIGRLFRYTRDDSARTDLVIEITPRIVADEGMVPEPPELPGE